MEEEKFVPFERFKEKLEKRAGNEPDVAGAVQEQKSKDGELRSIADFKNEKAGELLALELGLPSDASDEEIRQALRRFGVDRGFVDEDEMDEKLAAVSERPDFGPRQILELAEISPGQKYIACHINRATNQISREEFVILGEPYKEEDSGWWVKIKVEKEGLNGKDFMPEEERSLRDMGVVSYKNGKWSPMNWLEEDEAEKNSSPKEERRP
ncbi:MAG: hypothetical protein Q7S36_00565 [Candidatus Liptonbacteria bacterium]|nr:hypothetical protein [Candidatus Liptonbacteria bacterium]